MKITFDRGLLAEAIELIKIADKDEGLLSAVTDGGADLQCRDDNVAISASTICKVDEPGEAVIDMKRLRAVAQASDAPSIEINSINDFMLEVRIGKSKYRFPTIDPNAFPRLEIGTDDMVELLSPDVFSQALTWAAPACEKNGARIIAGVGLLPGGDNETLHVVGTDGKRLLEQMIPAKMPTPVVMPVKAALALTKIIAKREEGASVSVASTARMFRLHTTGVKVQCPVLEGEYPQYHPIVNHPAFQQPTSIISGPAGKLGRYFMRASLARPNEPQVWIKVAQGSLRLLVGQVNEPDYDETVHASPEDAITINSSADEWAQYNLDHIRGALALFEPETIADIELTGPTTPARITTPAHPGFTLITMPFPAAKPE